MFDLGQIARFVNALSAGAGSLGRAPEGTAQRLWDETRLWIGKFASSVTTKWLPFYAEAKACEVPELRHGVPFPCTNHAIGLCDGCDHPVCLHHARVDQYGEVICYPCIAKLMRQKEGATGRPDEKYARAEPTEIKRELVKRALAALGLRPGATWDEVRASHKKLAVKHHPDRARTDAQRKTAAEKCTKVNAAFADLTRLNYDPEAA